jgi:adenylylsulfate kinase
MVAEHMGEQEIVRAIVVTGPVGAGKSTTAAAVSDLLGETAITHAMIDMDHLRWIHPSPPGDLFAARLGYRNLAAIWPNLREAGVTCVILADVVESREQFREYEAAMPGAVVTVVRLDVPMAEIAQRLHARETDRTIAWYLHRAPELQAIMERESVGDIIIDVGSRPLADIAREIIVRTGIASPTFDPGTSVIQSDEHP